MVKGWYFVKERKKNVYVPESSIFQLFQIGTEHDQYRVEIDIELRPILSWDQHFEKLKDCKTQYYQPNL